MYLLMCYICPMWKLLRTKCTQRERILSHKAEKPIYCLHNSSKLQYYPVNHRLYVNDKCQKSHLQHINQSRNFLCGFKCFDLSFKSNTDSRCQVCGTTTTVLHHQVNFNIVSNMLKFNGWIIWNLHSRAYSLSIITKAWKLK